MFKTVLSQHSLARRILSVDVAERGRRDMTCLIDWIEDTIAIENVVLSAGEEVMTSVLLALRGSNCVIRRAWFTLSSSDACLLMLPAFSEIETCVFTGHMDRDISLSPLTSVLTLTSLVLEDGWFTDLDATEHLTCLSLTECRAFCSPSCTFVSCLVELQLANSRLQGLHHDGPAMCLQLQSLCLSGAHISWGPGLEALICDVDIPFEGLSTLTALIALTQLHVTLGDEGCELTSDLPQLYRLTKLQCLSLTVPMRVKFSHGLQDLSCLTSLRLRGHGQHEMVFDVSWEALADLHYFELSNALFVFERDLSELATVSTLEKVVLSQLQKSNMQTRSQIANFVHRSGLLKSGIEFVID